MVQALEVLLVEPPLAIRCPDLVVSSEALLQRNPARVRAADVLLVVEIASEGTARMDCVMKLSEYDEAGIGCYWIVEPEPLRLRSFVLEHRMYREAGSHTGPADLVVASTLR